MDAALCQRFVDGLFPMNPLFLCPMCVQFEDLLIPSGVNAERRYVIVTLQCFSRSGITRILISLAVNAGVTTTYFTRPFLTSYVVSSQSRSLPSPGLVVNTTPSRCTPCTG